MKKLESVKNEVKKWNKEVFGDVRLEKKCNYEAHRGVR